MLILIVAGGPDKGRMYEVAEGQPTVLGREAQDIRLSDRKASREHAKLWCEGGRWYLRDLDSKHGTFRNHERLQGQAPLADGDYVQIGNTVLVVVRMTPASASPAAECASLMGPLQGAKATTRWAGYVRPALAAAAILLLGVSVVLAVVSYREGQATRALLAALQAGEADRVQADRQLASQVDASLREVSERDAALLKDQQARLAEMQGLLGEMQLGMARLGDQLESASRTTQAVIASNLDRAQADAALIASMDAQQRSQDSLLADVAWLKKSQQSRADTVALASHEVRHLLQQVPGLAEKVDGLASRMDDLPDAALVSKLGVAMQSDAQATRALMAQAIRALESRPDADAMASALREQMELDAGAMTRLVEVAVRELKPGASADEVAGVLRDALAEQARQTDTLLAQVLEKLEQSPSSEAIAAQIRQHVAADQQTLAQEIKDSLAVVVARLEDSPTRDQLVADVRDVIRHDGRHAEDALTRVLARLDETPTSRQLADDLRLALAEDDVAADALLRQVLVELEKRPTAEQINQWSEDQQVANAKAVALMSQVLRKLDTQDVESELVALRKLIAQQPDEVRQLTEQVIARLDDERVDRKAVLASMKQVQQALPAEMTEAFEKALAGLDGKLIRDEVAQAVQVALAQVKEARDEETSAALKEIAAALANKPDAEHLARLTSLMEKQVDALLGQTGNTKALGQLAADIKALARERDDDPVLTQVLQLVERQRDLDAKLAEVRQMLADSGDVSPEALTKMLASVNAASAEETQLMLRQMLTALRRDVAFKDDIEIAKRDILRSQAMWASRSTQDMLPLENPDGQPVARDTEGEAGLSRTELAYRNAFRSGRTVVLRGLTVTEQGSKVDNIPLDPQSAKAAGFETWREWYLADMERLQTEIAKRHSAMQEETLAAPNRIELPSGDPSELNSTSEQRVIPRR